MDKLIAAERIVSDDAEDTGLLQQMLQEATDYLTSFRWCPPVEAKATPDNARSLLRRTGFIRTRLLPDWRAEWNLGT